MAKALNYLVIFVSFVFCTYFALCSFLFAKFPIKFEDTVAKESYNNGLKQEVVYSIIAIESGFDRCSTSKRGAMGLMQIMPQTANFVESFDNFVVEKDKTLYDADYNIKIGTAYFKYLANKFDDNLLAICAYNAGETVVSEWLSKKIISRHNIKKDKIPYAETRNYIRQFELALKIYKQKIK